MSKRIPMGLGIPPLEIKIMLESNPLRSRIVVGRLAVHDAARCEDSSAAGLRTSDWRCRRSWTTSGRGGDDLSKLISQFIIKSMFGFHVYCVIVSFLIIHMLFELDDLGAGGGVPRDRRRAGAGSLYNGCPL